MFGSLPIWERGLKPPSAFPKSLTVPVAPYMGAWIETPWHSVWAEVIYVAPYMGAWIETIYLRLFRQRCRVAPYMGAWIETARTTAICTTLFCRSLYGSVD